LTGANFTITGTASSEGSTVQQVEVGITPGGGGTTWYLATGTNSWSYTWTLPADGSYTIQSRATDDIVNVETPGAGVDVTVDNSGPIPVFNKPSLFFKTGTILKAPARDIVTDTSGNIYITGTESDYWTSNSQTILCEI
jgi:hypothetical protein